MGKKLKMFGILCIGVLMFGLKVMSASALESGLDVGQTGSITIQLEETKEKVPLENVCFALIRVADVVDGELQFTPDFSDCQVDLNALSNAAELEAAASVLETICKASRISEDVPSTVIKTDKSGKAWMPSLRTGAYLLYVTDPAAYESINPCLILLPVYDQMNGSMQYDLTIYPKHAPIPQTSVPTGDASYIRLWILVCIFSFAMLILAGRHSNKQRSIIVGVLLMVVALSALSGCSAESKDDETETSFHDQKTEKVSKESTDIIYENTDGLYFLNAETLDIFLGSFERWLWTEGVTAERVSVDKYVIENGSERKFECCFKVYAANGENRVLGIYDIEHEAWTFLFNDRQTVLSETEETMKLSDRDDKTIQESLEEEAKGLSATYVPEPEDASLAPGYLSISNEAMLPESIHKDALLRDTAAYLEAMHDTRREVTIESVETDTSKPVVVFVFRTFLTDKEKLRVRWDVPSKSYVCSYLKGEKINETEKE